MVGLDAALNTQFQAYRLLHGALGSSASMGSLSAATGRLESTRPSTEGGIEIGDSGLAETTVASGPYVYHPGQAADRVAAILNQTDGLLALLDRMDRLVVQAASASDSGTAQSRFQSLVLQYEAAITATATDHRFRLNNDEHAVLQFVTSDYSVTVRTSDLRFPVGHLDLVEDNARLGELIGRQRDRIEDYQSYLRSAQTLLEGIDRVPRVDYGAATGYGVHSQSLGFAKTVVQQIVNDTLQQAAGLQAHRIPESSRVLHYLDARSVPLFWMLS